MTLNVHSIAKKRGLTPGAILSRLKQIKKKHPDFQLSGSARGSGTALTVNETAINTATPKAASTPSTRKKITKTQHAEKDSKGERDDRRRTRLVSRAAREESSDSEDEQPQSQTRTRSSSRAPEYAAVTSAKGSSTASSTKAGPSKAPAKAKQATNGDRRSAVQTDDDGSDKENDDDEQEAKPSPKTRGARKSVGRELEDTPPELPKPAPRGRNATIAKTPAAEHDSKVTAAHGQPVESIEHPEKSSCMKIKNTDFMKKLIAESSESTSAGIKRKRTPSSTSMSPSIPVQEPAQQTPQDESTMRHTKASNIDKDETTLILTPPQSPSRRPPAKKQQLNEGESESLEQPDMTQGDVGTEVERLDSQQDEKHELSNDAEDHHAVARSSVDATSKASDISVPEKAPESAVAPQVAADASVDYMNVDSIEDLLDQSIQSAASSDTDAVSSVPANLEQPLTTTTDDVEAKNDILSSLDPQEPKKPDSPRRFAWMTWDPNALPDPTPVEGLGRVVSNEYAREWRERNAAIEADE